MQDPTNIRIRLNGDGDSARIAPEPVDTPLNLSDAQLTIIAEKVAEILAKRLPTTLESEVASFFKPPTVTSR